MQISVLCQRTNRSKPFNSIGNQVLIMHLLLVLFKLFIRTDLLPLSSWHKTRVQMVSRQSCWTPKSKRSEVHKMDSGWKTFTSKTRMGTRLREFQSMNMLSHQTRCWQTTRRLSEFTVTKIMLVQILVLQALVSLSGNVPKTEMHFKLYDYSC